MNCAHKQIDSCSEWNEDMHCEGWHCHACGTYIDGGCHPRTWCRDDFCGPDRDVSAPRLPARQDAAASAR